ncbi:hypothetical protein [Streptomyces brasiliscabiei]|uniref:hypothetical protein n=1 Tax=Streptomyces brasiliscabiei TaxID=2736302 RepID=UPI0038F5D766
MAARTTADRKATAPGGHRGLFERTYLEALLHTLSMTHPLPPPAAASGETTTLETLRRAIDEQVGPRGKGAIYRNTDGAFEVLDLVRDPERARQLLNRRCAQWALIVRDVLRPDGEPFAIGSVWTTSDHLVREAGTDGGAK